MYKWPPWPKVLVAVAGVDGVIAVSQRLLCLDRMGASKFAL